MTRRKHGGQTTRALRGIQHYYFLQILLFEERVRQYFLHQTVFIEQINHEGRSEHLRASRVPSSVYTHVGKKKHVENLKKKEEKKEKNYQISRTAEGRNAHANVMNSDF